MALTEPAQFTTEKLKQAYRAVVFVDYADESKYWANEAMASFNGNAYTSELLNISAISATIDRDGGFATIGGLVVDLSNLEDYSDWLIANNIEGDEVKFYLVFNDGTALQFSESMKFFTGLIDDLEISYDRLSISVSHKDRFFDDIIGEIVTEDEYTDQLDEAIGKMKPIVYGNHFYNGSKPSAQWDPLESANMVPCVQVCSDKFIAANHELGYLTSDDIWLYHSSTGRCFHVNSSFVTVTNPDGNGDCIIDLSSGTYLEVYDYWHPRSVSDAPSSSWSNEDNAIDKDLTTYATLSSYSQGNMLIFNFDEYDYNDYARILGIDYYSAYDYSGGVWDVREEIGGYSDRTAYITDASHSGGTITVTTSQPHQFIAGESVLIKNVVGMTDINGSWLITDVPDTTSFEFEKTTSQTYTSGGTCFVNANESFDLTETTYGTPQNIGSAKLFSHESIGGQVYFYKVSGTTTINVRCIFKRIHLGVSFGSDFVLCAAANGKKDGANYIENPADVIEDIVDDYTSLSSSDFDSTALTAAQTARTDWDLDFCILNQINAKEQIYDLCKGTNIFGFWSFENKIKLIAYTQGASASLTANIDEFSETPGATSGVFDKNRIKNGSLRQKQVDIKEIANKINIDYAFDQIANRYQKRKSVENTTSQGIYGTFEKSFVNKYIFDDTTAQAYVDNMIDALSYKSWLCQMTAGISAFNVEIGDVIDIDNFINDDIKWLVLSIAHKPLDGTGWIDIQAIEQKDTSGDTINTTSTEWGTGEAPSGSGSGSFGVGGSGGGYNITFKGQQAGNESIEGIVLKDKVGRPVYSWIEVDEDGFKQWNHSLEQP